MPRDDAFFLRQMLDAARLSLSFAHGRTRAGLDDDLMFFYALAKSVEIIGEAASRVDRSVRAEYPAIRWENIIGMRNRLVHAFFDINRSVLWGIVQEHLPVLISQLETALNQPPE